MPKYGFAGQLLLNGGTYGSPTWGEADAVRDVIVGADMEEQDGTTRQGGGLKQSEPVLLALSVTGKIRSDEADTTGFVAMETAFLTRAALDVMVLDGAQSTVGSRGYRFDVKLFKFGEDQAIEGILYREFEMKPCISANAVKKAVVASGPTINFTSLAV